MKRTSKRVIAFFLILVLVLSLCACAQKQQAGTDEPNRSADSETLSGMPDQKLPEKLRPGAGGSDMQPTPTGFSAEAEQSLVWLRERMAFPQTMFGAAFLGYTGEASDGDWLSETDQATLQKYPFISEIDTGHTIGDDDYLYCLVPLDENATVSVNLMRWDSKSDTEEVIEVLYRSEVGDPLLIFAAGGDDAYAYLSYIQVQIVDNAGNSCVWEPQLYTSTGHIVPCFSENGDYLSFDFTEYGWQGVPSELRLEDEDLYAVVYRETGKERLRKLTAGELSRVIRALQEMKDSARQSAGRKRTDEGGDPRTVEQRRKLYKEMRDLGWSEAQVNGLARRMFKVERIEWLGPAQCGKLIEALKAIHARGRRKEAQP